MTNKIVNVPWWKGCNQILREDQDVKFREKEGFSPWDKNTPTVRA